MPVSSSSGVAFNLISGELPPGLRISGSSIIGTPFEVPRVTTFNFCIRASKNGQIADRTFSMDITGPDEPSILTAAGDLPAGPSSSYFVLDQSYVDFQISVIDYDTATGQTLHFFIEEGNGELPPGLSLSDTGLISGLVEPSYAIKITDGDGSYDNGYYDNVAYDFGSRSSNGYSSFLYDQIFYDYSTPTNPPKKLNRNYEFIISVTDGDTVSRQRFRMFVVSDDFFRADNTYLPAGTGIYKADGTYLRAPVWRTPAYLGIVRANNYVIEKLDIYEPSGDAIIIYDLEAENNWQALTTYQVGEKVLYQFKTYICTIEHTSEASFDLGYWTLQSLPPGMEFDRSNGEIFGVVPYQPAVTIRYTFCVTATRFSPQVTESAVTNRIFYIDIQGEVDSVIAWSSSTTLGTIPANFISNLRINASSSVEGATLVYTLESGRLPPGLTLKPDGEITGKVNQYGDVDKLGLTRFYDSSIIEIATTTTLTASTSTPPFGSNVVLTATVVPAGVTGTVTFKNGNTVLGTITLINGLAEFICNSLSVGSHSLTANYNRFQDYQSSTSSAVSVNVALGLTFISLTTSSNTSYFGNDITLSVIVTSPGGIPSGTVSFKDGATVVGTGVLSNNQTSLTINSLPIGNRSITAVYNSDGKFRSVTSSASLVTINPQIGTNAITALTVIAQNTVVSYGSNLVLTGTVIPATEGVIIFKQSGNVIGSSTIGSNNLGGVTASSTPGRFNYTSQTSLTVNQQITVSGTLTGTATILGYSSPKIYYVKTVNSSSSFTLSATPGGAAITTTAGTLTGLTFKAYTGTANLTTNKLGAGSYSITGTFSGNSYYAYDDSGTTPIIVNQIATAISFIASTYNPVYGNPFILEAKVTAAYGIPTGTITIKEGVTVLAVINLVDRLAIYTSSNRVTVGSHTYTAYYSGDSNYNSSVSYDINIVVQSATVPYSSNGISSSAITAELGGSRSAQYATWTLGTSTVTLKSTGLPYHSFGNVDDPNIPTAQDYNVAWPYRVGTYLPATSPVTITDQIIGFWLNGVAMYGPGNAGYAPIAMQLVEGFTYNASSEIQVQLNYTFGADAAGGHTLPNGKYHYHDGNFLPIWLTGNGGGNELPQNSTGIADNLVIPYLNDGLRHINGHSKILGIAADGYPVYGPYGYIDPTNSNSGLRRMTSGYALKNSSYRAGTAAADVLTYPMGMFVEDYQFIGGGDLDTHNGRYCVTPDFPNGTYAYFITVDSGDNPVFPYVIGNTFFGTPGGLGT